MVKGRFFVLGTIAISALLLFAGCASSASAAPQAEEEEMVDLSAYERDGFVVEMEDGRLWVFHEGSEDYEQFLATGEPAKQVVRPGAGPGGITIKSTESATIDEYLFTLPGYFARMEDGRLWIFKTGTEELEEFLVSGEPAKQVVRPGGGPYGMTIKAVDAEIIDDFMADFEASS
jgi:hypothetical protein